MLFIIKDDDFDSRRPDIYSHSKHAGKIHKKTVKEKVDTPKRAKIFKKSQGKASNMKV